MKTTACWLYLILFLHAHSASLASAPEVEFDISEVTHLAGERNSDQDEQFHQYSEKGFESLEKMAFSLPSGSPKAIVLWSRILSLNPRSSNARVQLGLHGITSRDFQEQERAFLLLQEAFDSKHVDFPVPMPTQQGVVLASVIGRYRWERQEFELSHHFLELAYNHSKGSFISACFGAQLATGLDPFPASIENADKSLKENYEFSSKLLSEFRKGKEMQFNEQALSTLVPGAATDPYVHCMLSIFHLSFYYRADVARVANTHYQIATALWPKLRHIPQKYLNADDITNVKPCRDGKIRLGIASGCLSRNHSVVCDFSGMLRRLDRTKFSVTYIYLNEQNSPVDEFVYDNYPDDTVLILRKMIQDESNGAWVTRYHPIIEKLELDVLLYLDLTMSSHAQRTAMAKLAKVQAVSHGHPITSGISQDTMDYYISWEAAELDYDVARKHYVEDLVLLPKETPHQYYERRLDDTRSLINGRDYRQFVQKGRNSTFGSIPSDGHWYLCMQKPHKFHPEMDPLVCSILAQDDKARVILHREENRVHRKIFKGRLRKAGCDMHRVHFLPVQPHHRLLALYSLADVILDSYPAGGCTTSREVLELGKAIVTLPARLLGSRWTYAYYQIFGDEALNEMVIAKTGEEYVTLAVNLGGNENLRKEAERRIKKSLHKLYHRRESVEAWEKVLLDIAPVTLPANKRSCKEEMRIEL